jgi:hypothetical protein
MNAMNLLRPLAGEIEPGAGCIVACYLRENTGLLLYASEFWNGCFFTTPLRKRAIEMDDAIGVGVRERLKQNRIDHRENGCVGTDAESQSGNNGNREAGVTPQLAQAETRVLPQELEACAHATIAHSLLDLLNTAGLGLCSAPRLRWGHAGSDAFVGQHIHVDTNFIVKLTFNLLLPEQVP